MQYDILPQGQSHVTYAIRRVTYAIRPRVGVEREGDGGRGAAVVAAARLKAAASAAAAAAAAVAATTACIGYDAKEKEGVS